MPTEITTLEDPNEVFRLSRETQIVEAQLAEGIYGVFNSGGALKKLQAVAKVILRKMMAGPPLAFRGAIAEEGNLRLWKKVPKNQVGFGMWQSPVLLSKLDASDCSDLIRLAGAWVEKGGLGDLAPASVKDAFRAGGDQVWGPTARVREAGWEIEPHIAPHMRDQNAGFTGMGGVGGHHGKLASKRAAGTSSLLKLDRLFGLIVACDISGTTADTVFALEFFGSTVGLTPAYYMLPLGTIAHNMHHSVLEVALATSLNGDMDYHIGFPHTLKPTSCGAFPPELYGLQRVLDAAHHKMAGLHHLRYYEGSQPKGAFKFDRSLDVRQLSNSPLSNAKRMLEWASGGGYPSRDDVVRLLRTHGMMM